MWLAGVEAYNVNEAALTYDTRYTNALYRYSVSTGTWTMLQARDCQSASGPACRAFHSSAVRSPALLVVHAGIIQSLLNNQSLR